MYFETELSYAIKQKTIEYVFYDIFRYICSTEKNITNFIKMKSLF